MALTPGTRLGPHEIVSLLGVGGMGEVYKARDTRLERIVAIKVLPADLANRPELCERFEREARTIANLNHPHICVLHDIGKQDGIDFLVMEYLEGETLATRLMKGPLPLQQVLQYAIEIADALDKAHRNGVTHRDLKPGNIILTKSGTKLLDFGLAKLKQEVAPLTPLSQLPTLGANPTIEGTLLGTLQYMAPEQVEGRIDEIDGRTDIFAFGALVYEMATGKKAFAGKSQASLIGAIMNSEPPPIASLQPMTPPALDRMVRRCLAKERDERWQSAFDLWQEVKWIAEGGSQIAALPAAPATGIRMLGRRPLALGLGALLLGAVIAGIAVWTLRPSPAPLPVTRMVITLPLGDRLVALAQPALALSPDGNYLAYTASRDGTQQLFLRAMDGLGAKPIPGTEGATTPFFSPDSQSLGFFSGGKLKTVSVTGGPALSLADGSTPRGASWGDQDMIVYSAGAAGALQILPDAGGESKSLTQLAQGENTHRWPEFLPGGMALLFARGTNTNLSVAVKSLGAGDPKHLVQGTSPHYAPSGHLIFSQGGVLMAAPFDPQRLETTGASVPVLEGVTQSLINGIAQFSISATGSLAYVTGDPQAELRKLVWVSRDGIEQPLAAAERAYWYPRISPDGRRIAIAIDERERHIWLHELSRSTLTRLTFAGDFNSTPAWTPDSNRIVFDSTKEGTRNLFWQLADGSGSMERLTTSNNTQYPFSWSPDGQLLAFAEVAPSTGYDIWVQRVGGPSAGSGQAPSASSGQAGQSPKAQPFLRTSFTESVPQFSPDGRWLAYVSNESGRHEIYVQPYPGPGGKWLISTGGGTEPVWNRNGRELFYRSGEKMMSVEISTQSGFAAGNPRQLFAGQYMTTTITIPNYDVSPDGQRFLMLKPNEQAQSATQINVVLNWFEELKRRVPTAQK